MNLTHTRARAMPKPSRKKGAREKGAGTAAAPNARFVGEYQGVGVGRGKCVLANGDEYEGEFTGGKRHGNGKCKYANGGVYKGEWNEGKRHGRGK